MKNSQSRLAIAGLYRCTLVHGIKVEFAVDVDIEDEAFFGAFSSIVSS
jgi:hypothetical protein